MPICTGPGAGDPFDPFDLEDVRQRVVMPVVNGLIRAQDLERIDVGWGPREPIFGFWEDPPLPTTELAFESRLVLREPSDRPAQLQADDELWVLVQACGCTWQSQLWQLEYAGTLTTMAEAAYRLADLLEDWVCESVYWGEQVVAHVTIPARRQEQ